MRSIMKNGILLLFCAFTLVLHGCQTMDGALQAAASVASQTGYLPSGAGSAIANTGSAFFKAAEGITEEQEYYLGRAIAVNLFDKYGNYDNPELLHYVNKVGNTVLYASGTPGTYGGYHFIVLDSDEVNAMATPGGYVFITKGTLKLVQNEDELANILAHEIAHVKLKHGVGTIKSSRLSNLAAITASEAGNYALNQYTDVNVGSLKDVMQGAVTDITNDLVTKGYSRSKEYEADAMAIEIVTKAGYNPSGLRTFLVNMDAMNEGNETGGWFKTHPKAKDRINRIDKKLAGKSISNPVYSIRTERFVREKEKMN